MIGLKIKKKHILHAQNMGISFACTCHAKNRRQKIKTMPLGQNANDVQSQRNVEGAGGKIIGLLQIRPNLKQNPRSVNGLVHV